MTDSPARDTSALRDTYALADVSAARRDARSRAQASEWMPYLPPSESPFAPAGLDPRRITWAETVAPGGYTHLRVAAGTRIRLDDPTGLGCAHVAVFNAHEPGERLNVADTVKIFWQAYLTAGHPLLSGDGRVLATIVDDTSATHDAFCGTSTPAAQREKYGDSTPEGAFPAGSDLLALAAAKHGLTERDIPPTLTFFQGTRVDADGSLAWRGSAGAGTHVTLLAEMPLIVLVAVVPHPRDPDPDFRVGPIRVHAWPGEPTAADDGRVTATPEHERSYRNTHAYAALAGL